MLRSTSFTRNTLCARLLFYTNTEFPKNIYYKLQLDERSSETKWASHQNKKKHMDNHLRQTDF